MGFVVLGLLMTIGPQTLYSLRKVFEGGAAYFYSASFGSLQSALKGLVAADHVTVREATENGRHKKIYEVTASGEQAFHAWMRSPLEGDLEVAALARIFHLGLEKSPADRREVLDGIVAAVESQLAGLQEVEQAVAAQLAEAPIPPELADVYTYQTATLEYGLMTHRASLDWLREFAAREADA